MDGRPSPRRRRGHPSDWLKAGNANLFALAGRQSLAGRLALDGKHELAEQQLADWQRVFGDGLHLELTRTGREGEETFNQFALMAAGQRGLPVVASNDVRFLAPTDFSAHEARVCIPPAAYWTTPSARASTATSST